MRAAQVILGTIAVLVFLSAAFVYFTEKTLVGFNPFVEVIMGTVLGIYVYKKEVEQKKLKNENNEINN